MSAASLPHQGSGVKTRFQRTGCSREETISDERDDPEDWMWSMLKNLTGTKLLRDRVGGHGGHAYLTVGRKI